MREGEKKIVINRQTLINSFVLEYEFYFVSCCLFVCGTKHVHKLARRD